MISTTEEILEEAKSGKIFILVDDENRENEGDLVIAAEFVTPEVINFMAKYGRGLICLTLTEDKVKTLNLPLMSINNNSKFQTAFTLSIEAKDGVTTGISAADRAHTIKTAINAVLSSEIVSPGHVFPIMARNGGVLVRAGHTEASVDIAKIIGANPSAVICEIMNDDGTMARLDDLTSFAKEHNLKIGTIADLIAYRRKFETLVVRQEEYSVNLETYGEFKAIVYKNKIDNVEHLALIKGEINTKEPVLVRMHSINLLSDVIADTSNNRHKTLEFAKKMIAENGSGIIVFLRDNSNDLFTNEFKNNTNQSKGTFRDYGIGAQILVDLKVKRLNLITKSAKSVAGMEEGYGIIIENTISNF